jgi:hypothetical protein
LRTSSTSASGPSPPISGVFSPSWEYTVGQPWSTAARDSLAMEIAENSGVQSSVADVRV